MACDCILEAVIPSSSQFVVVSASRIALNSQIEITFTLAALTKEDVPDSVLRAYGLENLKFGRDYIIPKPLDPRVLLWESPKW